MSVIGPRPLLVEYLPYYTKEEHHRHDVRPGLSGWAQINGRNAIDSWEQRFQYDLECNGRRDQKIHPGSCCKCDWFGTAPSTDRRTA